MTVAKYLRLSSEDNDLKSSGKRESNSIQNQRNLLDSFITRQDEFARAIVIEFCDDGWSGKNFERPGMKEMLEQVKAGKIQCIIVKDLSRFGRDYLTVGNYISRIFPFLGVRFIAVNDGLDSSRQGDIDKLDTAFKTLLYDLYSRDLSRKVKSAKRSRAQRGDFVAPFAPYGYMKSPENHNQLVIDPPAAEIVRRIFHLAADGHSTTWIARLLNDEAVLTPMQYKRTAGCSRTRWQSVSEDNFWTDHIIIKILRDERYIGTNTYGKRVRDVVGSTHTVKISRGEWLAVANTHEAIVAKGEFDRAQAALREFKEHEGYAEKQPLARKIRCGICGHILTPSNSKEKYYYCQTMRMVSNTECVEVHISERDVLAEVLKSLQAQAAVALDREQLLAEQHKTAEASRKSTLKQLAILQKSHELCSRESRELYETFAMGSVGKEEYLRKRAVLSKQKEKLSGQIAELETGLNSLDENTPDSFVEKFKPYLHSEKLPEEVIKELLKEVRVFPHKRLEIQWNYTKPHQN